MIKSFFIAANNWKQLLGLLDFAVSLDNHLQLPLFCLVWPPLCVISPWQQAYERDMEVEAHRKNSRVDSFPNFAYGPLYTKPIWRNLHLNTTQLWADICDFHFYNFYSVDQTDGIICIIFIVVKNQTVVCRWGGGINQGYLRSSLTCNILT